MDPFSAAAIASTALSVGSSIAGGNAEYAQGRYEANVATENAKRARVAAGQMRLAGQEAERAKRTEIRRSLGRSAAAASQAGIGGPSDGSAGAVIKQASREGEFDAQNVRYQYESDAYAQDLEALNQDAAATAARRRARQARTTGFLNAAGAALSGYTSYSGMKAQRAAMRPRATSSRGGRYYIGGRYGAVPLIGP